MENKIFSINTLRERLGSIHQVQGIRSIQTGDTLAALDHFRQSRKFVPDTLAVYQNLAFTYLQLDRYQEATSVADSDLARFSNELQLLRIKAIALFRLEEYQRLLSALKPSIGRIRTMWISR